MRVSGTGVGLLVLGMLLAVAVSPASATDYTVTGTSYTNTGTLEALELWDTYELTAGGGKRVSYTVAADRTNATGACVMLLWAKGHDVTGSSEYLVTYSQEDCVASFSSGYTIGSGDPSQWTVVVLSDRTYDVDYTLTVKIENAFDPTILGIIIIVVVVVAVIGIRIALRRRRQRMAPPAAPPMPPMPPMEPPQSPPPPQ